MEMALPITETEFFSLTMAKQPEIKQSSEYTIKKGDSLWGIAQQELSKKVKKGEITSFSRNDILNYTYQIAKLNKYDSMKKMNSIKINDKILLPEFTRPETKSQTTNQQQTQAVSIQGQQRPAKPVTPSKPASVVTRPLPQNQDSNSDSGNDYLHRPQVSFLQPLSTVWVPEFNSGKSDINPPFATEEQLRAAAAEKAQQKAQKPASKPVQQTKTTQKPAEKPKPKTNAQLGFEAIRNKIVNTKQEYLYATCSEGYFHDIYYLTIRPNYYEREEISAAFAFDKKGNLIDVSFDGQKDEMELRYDFTVDKNGTVKQSDEFGIETKIVDKIDSKYLKEMETILKQAIQKSKK